MSRPLILLSNDDGYLAPGIGALRTALSRFADVVLCAPAVNQSASSHSLTLHSVLRLRRIDDHTFALDGTTLSLLPDVVLPGAGFARRSFPIPDSPSVVGLTFAVQALFGPPDMRLSNVVVETVLR